MKAVYPAEREDTGYAPKRRRIIPGGLLRKRAGSGNSFLHIGRRAIAARLPLLCMLALGEMTRL